MASRKQAKKPQCERCKRSPSNLFQVIWTTSFSMSSARPFSRGSAIMVILFLVRKDRSSKTGSPCAGVTTQTSETVTEMEEAWGSKGHPVFLHLLFLNVYELFCLYLCTWTTCVQHSKKPDKAVRYPGLGL